MRIRSVLLATGFLIALPALAFTQEEEVRTIPFEGPEFFCHILHHEKLQPLRDLDEAEGDARNSILIVLGDPDRLHRSGFLSTGRFKDFLQRGGNVMIATDYPLHLGLLAIDIPDGRVRQNEKDAYRGSQECPRLNFGGVDLGNDHPLFRFLGKGIATNRPSYVNIRNRIPAVQPLLRFARNVTVVRNRRTMFLGPVPNMIGSPKNAPADGRILVIAGHGMFMNGMMVQPDNDNFEFTVNAIRWLAERGDGGRRTKAHLMVDGTVADTFDMKLTPGPPPLPLPTVEAVNRLLRGWEEEGFFPKLLEDALGDRIGRLVGILLVLATFGLILYGVKKFMEGRVSVETAAPSAVGVLPTPKTRGNLEERGQAKLRKRDYGAECRRLALEWMREQFDVTPDQWRPGVNAEFHVQGYFWPPWKLRRQADFVLRLARRKDAAFVSRHDFFVLAEALRDLTAALKEGRLALLVEGTMVRSQGSGVRGQGSGVRSQVSINARNYNN